MQKKRKTWLILNFLLHTIGDVPSAQANLKKLETKSKKNKF